MLQNDAWHHEAQLLVMPGGRDVPYHEALRGEANASIRRFVASGGSYLGLCAGAYYGCARISFDQGAAFEVIATRELGFFQGVAIGPAYGVGTYSYADDSGAQAAELYWVPTGDSLTVYYDGGCYFEADATNTATVLARYQDLANSPAAIVECPFGRGLAILSGVHPEFQVEGLNNAYNTPARVIERLSLRRADQASVLEKLLGRLLPEGR